MIPERLGGGKPEELVHRNARTREVAMSFMELTPEQCAGNS